MDIDIDKIRVLLEEYKKTCMGFATESHHKGNRDNTKFWTTKAKKIAKIIDTLLPKCEKTLPTATEDFLEYISNLAAPPKCDETCNNCGKEIDTSSEGIVTDGGELLCLECQQEQEPKASEFTQECRELCRAYEDGWDAKGELVVPHPLAVCAHKLGEACKRIDAAEAENTELRDDIASNSFAGDFCLCLKSQKLQAKLKTAEAENRQLKGEEPIPYAWWKDCPGLAQKTMERLISCNDSLQAKLKTAEAKVERLMKGMEKCFNQLNSYDGPEIDKAACWLDKALADHIPEAAENKT